ncbi:MAG: PQQ-binding-like beta-propeller repeat protein [Rhodopirellula sp. JB044]|uniref:outer membrane protein assembly factor BamB family protein n=1 Tax=Rhodopirellula sp. JB044 TaxID=3342844 RepID=UPI00370C8DBB
MRRLSVRLAMTWIAAWIAGMVVASARVDADEPVASGENWARFHGPNGTGRSEHGQLPQSWTTADYTWSVDLNGTDVGSPAVSGTQVFLLDSSSSPAAGGGQRSIDLVALELGTGKEQWRRSHPVAATKRHSRNSPASTTPAVADGRVFIAYGDTNGAYLYAYSLAGEPLWQRQLGPWSGVHGFGTSPMVFENQVVLFNSQQVDQLAAWQVAGTSHMMAFDAATGEDVWSTPLRATRPCYGVPAIYEPSSGESGFGRQLIGANKGNGMFGLDATTGELLWSLDVFNKRCCASPLLVGDIAVCSSGSGGGGNILSAVRIPSSKEEEPEELFRVTSAAPYVPSSVSKDGLLFTVSDSGIASCFDLSDQGRKRWSQRLGGNFGASPVIIGERLLFVSLDGTAHVTRASAAKERVSSFDLGGRVGATPAVSTSCLILRVGNQLHCLPISGRGSQG